MANTETAIELKQLVAAEDIPYVTATLQVRGSNSWYDTSMRLDDFQEMLVTGKTPDGALDVYLVALFSMEAENEKGEILVCYDHGANAMGLFPITFALR